MKWIFCWLAFVLFMCFMASGCAHSTVIIRYQPDPTVCVDAVITR
jgi:hypothetical protein